MHPYISALLVVYGTVGFNKFIPLHAELHMYNIGTCSKVMVLLEKCYKFQRTLTSTAANDSSMLDLRVPALFMCTSLTKFNLQILHSLSLCAFRCFARKTFPSFYVVVCNSYFVDAVHILVQNIVVCAWNGSAHPLHWDSSYPPPPLAMTIKCTNIQYDAYATLEVATFTTSKKALVGPNLLPTLTPP